MGLNETIEENHLAVKILMSNEEIEMLLDRRVSYPSTRKRRAWTKAERMARLTIMKWSV